MNLKPAWVTLILHTSSLIRKKKDLLQVSHSWKSIGTIVVIVLLETFLAVISIPLYLVQRTVGEESSGQVYRVRRVITLSLLVGIGIIWLIKLSLVALTIVFSNRLPEFEVKDLPPTSTQVVSQEEIFETERAKISTNLKPPSINHVERFRNGAVELLGSAAANDAVLIYLTRSDLVQTANNTEQLTILMARSDSKGAWSVRPRLSQFRFLAGNYIARAVAYDDKQKVKSSAGKSITFRLTRDQLTAQMALHRLDQFLNIMVFMLIGVGLGLTLLVT